MSDPSKSYNTLYKINQPVYHGGLKPLQWIFVLSVSFGAYMALGWFSLLIVLPIFWFIKRIFSENQKGNPDYLESLFIWFSLKRRFIDKSAALAIVRKNGKRN